MTEPVRVRISDDSVIVDGDADFLDDRTVRLFFESILGAQRTVDGWICPRRRSSLNALALRVDTFLERKGWAVSRDPDVDRFVRRDVERRRSFERTVAQANALRTGTPPVSEETMRASLADLGWNPDRPLRPHQEFAVLHGIAAANPANFSVPGAGKTASTLALAAIHLENETVDLVVVVGPLSAFRPWESETQSTIPHLIHPKRVRGPVSGRGAMYQRATRGDLLLLSYATAASDQLDLIELCGRLRVMLVVDESHRIKRFRGGYWAPALTEIARHARVRAILSGTPMPQGGRDLYSQMNVLWPDGELTGPRDGFAALVDRDFPAVVQAVQPFVSRAPKSSLGLPPYRIERHDVPLPELQSDIYLLVEDNFRRRLANVNGWQQKVDALRRNRPIRLLQAAANPDLLNTLDANLRLPPHWTTSPSVMERLARYRELETAGKLAAALRLVEAEASEGRKVVCWSTFLRNLDQLAVLVRANGGPAYQVDGRVPTGDDLGDDATGSRSNPTDQDTREQVIAQFLNHPGPAVLIANPASCSESISLHSACWTAIYLDRTYDSAQFLQSIDRIHRLGLPPNADVRVHILLATVDDRPTIDGLVDGALERKGNAMKALLEGAELGALGIGDDPLGEAEGSEEDLADLLRFLLGED